MKHNGPVVIATSRQKLPVLDASLYPIYKDFSKGAYIMIDAPKEKPDIILIGTGSEVSLILAAREKLLAENIQARVVSMLSCELFDSQPAEYKRHVLPLEITKLSVEAASTHGWHKYVGEHGDVIGLERFGASAPSEVVMKNLGFSVENVVEFATRLISKK